MPKFQHPARIMLLLSMASCADAPADRFVHELTGATMGTTFAVKVIRPTSSFDGAALQREIEERLAQLDARFSTYRPDSELSQFNATLSTAPIAVSKEFCDAVDAATKVSGMTDGAFDITVGPLVNLWGFGPDRVFDQPPDETAIQSAMATVGYSKLHADCSVPSLQKEMATIYVDLSAFAKGYAVDRVAALIEEHGFDEFLVEIGGELRAEGRNGSGKYWVVGIESPSYSGRTVQSLVELNDTGIATSGDYRNYVEYQGTVYSHTIDPRTGRPVSHSAASVSVIDVSAAFADAMATALLVLGPKAGIELAEREGIAAIFVIRSGTAFTQHATSAVQATLRSSGH